MKNAQKRDAVLNQKFWFRKQVLRKPQKLELYEYACKLMNEREAGTPVNMARSLTSEHVCSAYCKANGCDSPTKLSMENLEIDHGIEMMTIDEIMNGKVRSFFAFVM